MSNTTITLQVGKRYVTRDGQVTSPLRPYVSTYYPFQAEVGDRGILHAWTRRGRCDHVIPDPSSLDLVAEYPPAAEAPAPTEPPLKNRSGTPASTSSSNLGHPQDAIVIGYDMAPLPYPDHTPPELPSPWHRWEYQGTQVSGVQPPWYSVVEVVGDAGVSDIQRVGPSAGIPGFHYFQAVTDAPMLCVNGIWFPEPCREPLKWGQDYFIPAPASTIQHDRTVWADDEHDNRLLTSGLIHLTAEAATSHARAMLSLAESRDIVNS